MRKNARTRRGAMEILYDILNTMAEGRTFYTHIIHKANLGGSTVQRIMIPVLNSDLVIEDGSKYRLSAKGFEALRCGARFIELCEIVMIPERALYGYLSSKKRVKKAGN